MDLNKHIVVDDNGSPFHSNCMANVVNGNHIGASGQMTFIRRQETDKNRRLIYGYQRSAIGSSYGAIRAKAITPEKTVNGDVIRSRQRFNSRGSINSTPARKYDPYA